MSVFMRVCVICFGSKSEEERKILQKKNYKKKLTLIFSLVSKN